MVCMVSPDCNTLVVCCFMYNSLNNTRNTIPYRYLIFVTEVGGERAIVFEMMYRLICFTALTLGIISSTDFRASEYTWSTLLVFCQQTVILSVVVVIIFLAKFIVFFRSYFIICLIAPILLLIMVIIALLLNFSLVKSIVSDLINKSACKLEQYTGNRYNFVNI